MTHGGFEGRLQDFGLSEKEAAVYRSLLHLGEAKPSEIASAANVSTRYVYAVGERLASRGFVTVNDHVTPTVMRALPPEEVIDGLRSELADLETSLRDQYEAPDRGEMNIEVLRTSMTLRKRLRTCIDRASTSIVLSIPATALDDITAELRDARDRDVMVLLVLGKSSEIPEVTGLADIVRTQPQSSFAMGVIDGRSSLVMTPDMLNRSNSGDRTVICIDERMGELLFTGYIGRIWLLADEEYCRPPDPLPATYSHFQRAVMDVALHHREGTTVHTRIQGSVTPSSSSIDVAGTIVDVRQPYVSSTNLHGPPEATIVVDTGDEHVEVGGPRALDGRFRAAEIHLRSAE